MVVRVVARVDPVVLDVVKGFTTLVWLSFVCRVSNVDDTKGLHDVSANIDTTNMTTIFRFTFYYPLNIIVSILAENLDVNRDLFKLPFRQNYTSALSYLDVSHL